MRAIAGWLGRSVAVGLLAALPGPASADMTDIEQATEVMMESQGLQGVLLGMGLEPDYAAVFNFTSNVGATSFHYELDPGSTYLGESFTWSTTGTLDSGTGIWHWSTTSAIGSMDVGDIGEGGPFIGVDPPYYMPLDLQFSPITYVFSDVTYETKNGVTKSAGTITVKDEKGKVLETGKHTDTLLTEGPNKGRWQWSSGVFSDQKTGEKRFKWTSGGLSSLPTGGAGAFTGSFVAVPVPEPASVLLAGLGVPCLAFLARRREVEKRWIRRVSDR